MSQDRDKVSKLRRERKLVKEVRSPEFSFSLVPRRTLGHKWFHKVVPAFGKGVRQF